MASARPPPAGRTPRAYAPAATFFDGEWHPRGPRPFGVQAAHPLYRLEK